MFQANRQYFMKIKEHIGHVTAINGSQGVVYSEISGDEYYFKIDKNNKNLKVLEKVVFLLGMDRLGIEENAYALRKIYVNSKGMKFYSRVSNEHIHLNLDVFLPDLIEKIIDYENNIIEIENEYPEKIGYSSCVEINENDRIIYAKRKGRENHTKFVLDRKKEPCNSLFAVFKYTDYGYLILTIFIGKKAGREPWDKFATEEDKQFWKNHALVFDNIDIIQGSLVSKCPLNY